MAVPYIYLEIFILLPEAESRTRSGMIHCEPKGLIKAYLSLLYFEVGR